MAVRMKGSKGGRRREREREMRLGGSGVACWRREKRASRDFTKISLPSLPFCFGFKLLNT